MNERGQKVSLWKEDTNKYWQTEIYYHNGKKSGLYKSFSIPKGNVLMEKTQESMCLDQIVIKHIQLNSILMGLTKNLNKELNLCFYITLMKCDSILHMEIFEDYPNDYLFETKHKRGSLYKKMNREIYGYVKCDGIDVYFLLYPNPCKPNIEVLNNLIRKTKEKIIINRKTKKYYFTQENPMWLYQYFDNYFNLVESVNDKGFLLTRNRWYNITNRAYHKSRFCLFIL